MLEEWILWDAFTWLYFVVTVSNTRQYGRMVVSFPVFYSVQCCWWFYC